MIPNARLVIFDRISVLSSVVLERLLCQLDLLQPQPDDRADAEKPQYFLTQQLFNNADVSPREQIVWMEAGCLISILPILIMYVFLQKYFTEGIERSGLVG